MWSKVRTPPPVTACTTLACAVRDPGAARPRRRAAGGGRPGRAGPGGEGAVLDARGDRGQAAGDLRRDRAAERPVGRAAGRRGPRDPGAVRRPGQGGLAHGHPARRVRPPPLQRAGGGHPRRRQAQESPLTFEAVVAPRLEIRIDRARVDLAARRLQARFSRPAARAEVKVVGATGGPPLAEAEQDLGGRAAGEPLEIHLAGAPRRRARWAASICAFTTPTAFTPGVSLYPWSVHIPHEEVNFATDSAAIGGAEEPKLQASYRKIAEALARHRELGPIKLYIAGHTDTRGRRRLQPAAVAPAGARHRLLVPPPRPAAARAVRGLRRARPAGGHAGRDRRGPQPPRRLHPGGGGPGAEGDPLSRAAGRWSP